MLTQTNSHLDTVSLLYWGSVKVSISTSVINPFCISTLHKIWIWTWHGAGGIANRSIKRDQESHKGSSSRNYEYLYQTATFVKIFQFESKRWTNRPTNQHCHAPGARLYHKHGGEKNTHTPIVSVWGSGKQELNADIFNNVCVCVLVWLTFFQITQSIHLLTLVVIMPL